MSIGLQLGFLCGDGAEPLVSLALTEGAAGEHVPYSHTRAFTPAQAYDLSVTLARMADEIAEEWQTWAAAQPAEGDVTPGEC